MRGNLSDGKRRSVIIWKFIAPGLLKNERKYVVVDDNINAKTNVKNNLVYAK